MTHKDSISLEQDCRKLFEQNEQEVEVIESLELWKENSLLKCQRLYEVLLEAAPRKWDELIEQSDAANHNWYSMLENEVNLNVFAKFLREEDTMPAFVPLLRKCAAGAYDSNAKAAIAENIESELGPPSHAQCFEKLLTKVDPKLESLSPPQSQLAEANLAYYYGYFVDSFFLSGVLYATELMLADRANKMNRGLTRLNLSEEDRAFMIIHSEIDLDHAHDWLSLVLAPKAATSLSHKKRACEGIAIRLYTSAYYLNGLVEKYSRESNH